MKIFFPNCQRCKREGREAEFVHFGEFSTKFSWFLKEIHPFERKFVASVKLTQPTHHHNSHNNNNNIRIPFQQNAQSITASPFVATKSSSSLSSSSQQATIEKEVRSFFPNLCCLFAFVSMCYRSTSYFVKQWNPYRFFHWCPYFFV